MAAAAAVATLHLAITATPDFRATATLVANSATPRVTATWVADVAAADVDVDDGTVVVAVTTTTPPTNNSSMHNSSSSSHHRCTYRQ